MNFLDINNPLFPEEVQDDYYKNMVLNYFNLIKNEINELVKAITVKNGKITKNEIKNIVKDSIYKHFDIWEKATIL